MCAPISELPSNTSTMPGSEKQLRVNSTGEIKIQLCGSCTGWDRLINNNNFYCCLGKPQKTIRSFFSGPATKALHPPRVKWPQKKCTDFF